MYERSGVHCFPFTFRLITALTSWLRSCFKGFQIWVSTFLFLDIYFKEILIVRCSLNHKYSNFYTIKFVAFTRITVNTFSSVHVFPVLSYPMRMVLGAQSKTPATTIWLIHLAKNKNTKLKTTWQLAGFL